MSELVWLLSLVCLFYTYTCCPCACVETCWGSMLAKYNSAACKLLADLLLDAACWLLSDDIIDVRLCIFGCLIDGTQA